MEQQVKDNLSDGNVWKRLLYMLFFCITYVIAEAVLTFVAIFQFFHVLITGHANEPLLSFGQNLRVYIADVLCFQTFNSEYRPFPFAEWPDEPVAEDNIWREAPDGPYDQADDVDEGTNRADIEDAQIIDEATGDDGNDATPDAEAPEGGQEDAGDTQDDEPRH